VDKPVELIPLICPRCSTPVPAESGEVAWVCSQCGEGWSLEEERGLAPLRVEFSAGIAPNTSGKPYWVVEGQVSLQRQAFGSNQQQSSEAEVFWRQPRRFLIPAYTCTLEELLDLGTRMLLQPPALQPGAPVRFDPATLAPGLTYGYYERSVRRAAALAQWVPTARDTVATVGLRGTERAEQFGARLTGFLRVPADGVYEFALLSDDGSVLQVAGQTVVDHDGPHSANTATGAIALAAGLHPFELLYFQGDGDHALELRMRRGDEEWRNVPSEWLYRQR